MNRVCVSQTIYCNTPFKTVVANEPWRRWKKGPLQTPAGARAHNHSLWAIPLCLAAAEHIPGHCESCWTAGVQWCMTLHHQLPSIPQSETSSATTGQGNNKFTICAPIRLSVALFLRIQIFLWRLFLRSDGWLCRGRRMVQQWAHTSEGTSTGQPAGMEGSHQLEQSSLDHSVPVWWHSDCWCSWTRNLKCSHEFDCYFNMIMNDSLVVSVIEASKSNNIQHPS